MTLHHPFERIPAERLPGFFLAALALTAATGVGVFGLVSMRDLMALLELVLAGSTAAAERVLEDWTPRQRLDVAFLAGLDLVFGLAWTLTAALACVWASRLFRRRWLARLGIALAWACGVAALLDVPENLAYFHLVRGSAGDALARAGVLSFYARVLIFFALDAYLTLAVVVWLPTACVVLEPHR